MKFAKQDTAQDIKGIQDTMRQGLTWFKRSDTRRMDKRNARYESMNHESTQAIHDNTRDIKDSHDTQDINESHDTMRHDLLGCFNKFLR